MGISLRREGSVRRSPQEGKVGYLVVHSDRRETTAASGDTRFMSDWNMYDALSEGNSNTSKKK